MWCINCQAVIETDISLVEYQLQKSGSVFSHPEQFIIMRQTLVLALVALAVVNAAPLSVESKASGNVKNSLVSEFLSKKLDQKTIDVVIERLNQKAEFKNENKKRYERILKNIADRGVNLHQLTKSAPATQIKPETKSTIDFAKKAERNIAQLKDEMKLPKKLQMSEDSKQIFKKQTKAEVHEIAKRLKMSRTAETAPATQNDSKHKFDTKAGYKLTQLKDEMRLPENYKLSKNAKRDFKMPRKFDALKKVRSVSLPENMRIPKSVQLPENFRKQLQ